MLKSLLVGFGLSVVILALIYVGDLIVTMLNLTNNVIATTANVTPVTDYSNATESIFKAVAWIVLLIIGGGMLVYGIHIKRR